MIAGPGARGNPGQRAWGGDGSMQLVLPPLTMIRMALGVYWFEMKRDADKKAYDLSAQGIEDWYDPKTGKVLR
jgi:hypothetical protein